MKKLDIVTYGNPELTKPSAEIPNIDGEIRDLVEEMFYTMYKAPGVGLAAPQIGDNRRLFIIGFEEAGTNIELVVINPTIKESFGADTPFEEGCLSVPGISATVMRPSGVHLEGIDLNGEPLSIRTGGFLARVIQHEFDHLQGTLFVDRLDSFEQDRIERQLHKVEKKTRKKMGIR